MSEVYQTYSTLPPQLTQEQEAKKRNDEIAAIKARIEQVGVETVLWEIIQRVKTR